MKKAFATNLRKARTYHGWTQQQAAKVIGIGRAKYGSYEEGRAEPGSQDMIKVALGLGITNLLGFLSDPGFKIDDQDKGSIKVAKNPLQSNYQRLKGKELKIVDLILFDK